MNVKILIGTVFEKLSYLVLMFGICAGKFDIFNGSKALRLVKNIKGFVTAFIKKADIDFSKLSLFILRSHFHLKYYNWKTSPRNQEKKP